MHRSSENDPSVEALANAMKAHKKDVVHTILEDIDINASNCKNVTPLIAAADANCPEYVDVLVKRRANVNCPGPKGRTPLMYACLRQNLVSVRLLVRAAADLNATDQDGLSPLLIASNRRIQRGSAIMKLLVTAQAQHDMKTKLLDKLLSVAGLHILPSDLLGIVAQYIIPSVDCLQEQDLDS